MQFFDSHAHYNDEKFNQDKDNVLKEIYNQDITRLVCAGYNYQSSVSAIEISKENDWIYTTIGISPNDVEDLAKVDSLEELLKEKKIVAIGEIGLDYYWNKENKDIQKELFIKQIELANKYNLPIVIHTRDAAIDTIDILKNHPCNKKGVFHCCPLNQELIKEGLKLGFYISFSGNITFKNAKSDACIELVPLDRILIETDSPYLAPEPLRGTRNDSRNVKLVAQKIASVRNLSLEEVAKITYDNANRIFNLP
jgi:TatD DNase family protein